MSLLDYSTEHSYKGSSSGNNIKIIFHKMYLAVFSHNKRLMHVVQDTSNVMWTILL